MAAVVSVGTGAVLASRRPRHPVGWLLLGLAVSVVASGLVQWYRSYGLLARPGSLPAVRYAALLDDVTFIAWPPLVGFVLLLTPTGHLPSRSRRWRWWAAVTAVAPVAVVVGGASLLLHLAPCHRCRAPATAMGRAGRRPVRLGRGAAS